MRIPLLILFILGFSGSIIAQKIQVIQSGSAEPISGVAIFNSNKSKSGITDFDGFVSIDQFQDDEVINFQHISHLDTEATKRAILANNNQVSLTLKESTLDEIVLSVAKFGQQKKDVPQRIASVTSEDVLFTNPQTAADLLESSGQVYVQKSQLGGGSPLIRGFSTNRLLIAVDGIRFNTAIFRGGNVQNVISIDPFMVERTEVILGPGSVVYGSDAIGGVMNFYTKRPAFSFEEGLDVSGRALARYASANNEKTGHFDINLGMKEWGFRTSITYSDFDDLRMGSFGPNDYLRTEFVETIDGQDVIVQNPDPQLQRFTGYDQINLMQKIRYSPSKDWDFELGLFYTTTGDYPRYDRLIRRDDQGQLESAEWNYGPQEWVSGNFQVSHQQEGVALFDDSKYTFSYQRFKESRSNRDFGDTTRFETDETVHAISGGIDLTKKLGKTNIFYGLEYVHNKVRSNGLMMDITTGTAARDASRYPDGAIWQSAAAYGSLQSQLSETLSFQGGIRYNHIIVDANFLDNNQFFALPFERANFNTGAVTGSAGIAWNPNKTLGWKINFGTAFRAPNIDDVGKIFDSEPGSVVVPNPDVEAEYSYNGEVGASLNFDDVLKLDMSTYYTVLIDALVRRDFSLNGETEIEYQGELSTVQAIQNAGEARVYGFEVGVEVNFTKALQLRSQYNITDGYTIEEDGSRAPIRHAAPPFGNTHLSFAKEKWKLDAFAEYNGQFDFQDLAPSQQNNAFLYALDGNGNPFSPSWYTLNFGAQYQATEEIQFTATLENITDQRYRPYSSGIAAAGRNLILSANYSF